MEQVREVLRVKHYSTERDMDGAEVAAFLSHLATGKRVAASTQNQALNALVFLYQEVLRLAAQNLGRSPLP